MLLDRGFVRVRPLLGGLDAWADAGYTLERLDRAAPGGAADSNTG